MLAQGTPLEVIVHVLGHSSIAITRDVYGHLRGGQRDAADQFDVLLRRTVFNPDGDADPSCRCPAVVRSNRVSAG